MLLLKIKIIFLKNLQIINIIFFFIIIFDNINMKSTIII